MNFIKAFTKSRLKNRVIYAILLIFFLGMLTYQLFVLDFQLGLSQSESSVIFEPQNTSQQFKIQYNFDINETIEEKSIREERRDSVKNGFLHAWRGYTKYAWGYDELRPVSNAGRNKFNS